MENINVTSHKLGDIHLHLWKTDKFKTVSIILMMKASLSVDTVTARALIPEILKGGTKDYPSWMMIKRKLDNMYGAVLETDVQKKGEQHVITFRMDVAAERCLPKQVQLFQEALALLYKIVTEPRQENGIFIKEVVEQEKRVLKQKIQSVSDNKVAYAVERMIEEMFDQELYRLPAYGRVEDLDVLEPEDIYDVYKQMLAHDRMDLFIIGSFDETQAKEEVVSLFGAKRQVRELQIASTTSKAVIEEKVVCDKKNMKQGQLHLGYRTYTTFVDNDCEAMRVADCIFGGSPLSKLFINVRQKESLAYYVGSILERHKGVLMVMAGIEFDKYDQVVYIIKEQVAAMKRGDFTEQDIEQAKGVLLNQLWQSVDTALGFVDLFCSDMSVNGHISLLDCAETIKNVTKEDIVRAANKWELDTIYFLTREGEEK
ncbi:EF-P 5-aminopentanol modification-associated protein YfmF [Shouchella lonarensis]|uniref:Predicted Zn-dependent peptidase n=1 Tax=Shouchella lonarensis TaxID=1464122 RepID=A0A1G6NHP0_9BACI|nr:pitrilysin family protein [Shouchella lonarensis]SDC67392.1 Predicted Zn-dependent peptidase [Shouchella lonarensis]